MAKSLATLLFVALALPAHLTASSTYPHWAKTTSTLNVRQGDEIVGQLDKGQTVYVLWPDAEEGWVAIEYDLDRDTPHRVSAAYLEPYTMPERHPPVVGQRSFRIFMGELYGAQEVTIAGHTYPKWTVFDSVCDGEQCRIIGPDGEPSSVIADELPHSMWITRKWDIANDVPTTYDYKQQYFRRYYHGFTRLLSRRWFYWTLFLALFAYVGLFAVGIGEPQVTLWAFLLLVPLWIGSCQGDGYNALQHRAEIAGGLLEGMRSEFGGVFKPFPSHLIAHGKGDGLSFGDWIWVPLFLLGHVILLSLFPWVFRGAHFLLVPHPAEKHLTTALSTGRLNTKAVAASVGRGNMANPPPKWVSENQKRRLDALRDRFRAETGLLNAAIDWKRKKAELEDP